MKCAYNGMENTKKALERDANILAKKCLEGMVNFKTSMKNKFFCLIANEQYPLFGVKKFCSNQGEVVIIENEYKTENGKGVSFKRYYECLRGQE